MGLNLAKVHVFEKEKGTSRVVLKSHTPYVRLSEDKHAPVFVNKTGAFYKDGSPADVDEWVKQRLEALTDEAKRQINYPGCIGEKRKPGRPRRGNN